MKCLKGEQLTDDIEKSSIFMVIKYSKVDLIFCISCNIHSNLFYYIQPKGIKHMTVQSK